MPYLSDPTDPDGFGQPDLVAQNEALLRRKALLVEQARQAAAQLGIYAPAQPDNSEVGGFTLSTGQRIPGRVISNWGTALKAAAPLVAQAKLQSDQSDFDKSEAVFNEKTRADALARLQAAPQGSPAIPGHLDYTTGSDSPTAMTSGAPATEPSLRDQIAFAMSLQGNPRTAGIGGKLLDNQLVTRPEKLEERAYQSSEKEKDRINAQVVERLKMLRPDLDFQTDNYGNVTAYDKHTGQQVPIKPLAGAATPTPVGGPGTGANPTPTVGQGKPSASVDKQIAEAQERTRQATNSLQQIDTAHELLKDTVSGTGDAVLSWARKHKMPFAGEPNIKDINDEALKGTAQWLASTFPRGPGDITVAERQMFQKAVANIGDSTVDANVRAGALDIVAELIAKASGLPVPPKRATLPANATPASTTADRVPGSSMLVQPKAQPSATVQAKQDLAQANARYKANPTPANKNARDLAWSDVERLTNGSAAPKRVLKWNPQTQRAE